MSSAGPAGPVLRDCYDAVVIGGGPAGLAAATWLARYRRSVVVVDSGEYRSAPVERTHGYLGSDPADPRELLRQAREQLARYPTAAVLPGRVVAAQRLDTGEFSLTVAEPDRESSAQREISCPRLILACGVADRLPRVAGIEEHYGASAFHCPACDGYDACGRDVVAIGWDARLAGFATSLLDWARSVTLVTSGHRFAGDEMHRRALTEIGVAVVEEPATALLGGRGRLTAVRLANGAELPASLVFFSLGHLPRSGLARQLGAAVDREGYVVVDECGATSVPGLYAAGDLTPGVQLVQVAAAKGTVAGVHAATSLHGTAGRGSPAPAPDVAEVAGELADRLER